MSLRAGDAVIEAAERRAGARVCEYSIRVERLVHAFADGTRAVDGLDLEIAPGELFALLGPNGSGKTTTVRMLTTLLAPTSGHATVAGHDVAIDAVRVRASIGAALQEVALDPLLTALDHMRLVCTLHGMPAARQRHRIDELMTRVGLSDVLSRRVRTYSGGMKRRLDLALALVHRPTVVFLDEPTTGLDPQSRAALWDEIRRLAREEGVTVFLTTQYLEEADVLADHVAIIDRGRIVAEGTPEALKALVGGRSVVVRPCAAARVSEVLEILSAFGTSEAAGGGAVRCRLDRGTTDLAVIVRALDRADIDVESLEAHAPTLDDVFFAKTGRQLEGDAHHI
jgi:ABC-2 type transport system ATP-binding protein